MKKKYKQTMDKETVKRENEDIKGKIIIILY